MERLLTPGSIPQLAMRRCVLGKDTLRYFQLMPSSLAVVEAKPDERLEKEPTKVTLRWSG